MMRACQKEVTIFDILLKSSPNRKSLLYLTRILTWRPDKKGLLFIICSYHKDTSERGFLRRYFCCGFICFMFGAIQFLAYQLVKDLTSEKQGRSSTIQDKSGKCLTEEKEIRSRWTEYCSELYNYESCRDNAVLDCSQPPEEDLQPILREEVEIAVASLKKGKSAGVDNIPAELVQAGGETMRDVLTEICDRIWRTGEWPTPWTQSLIITLPKTATCSSVRTTELSASSVIQAKSC